MALTAKLSRIAASAAADAICALLNSGYLRIYSGVQPTDPETAITTQVLLAELRFGATAFGAASNGVAVANPITGDSSADATGTATWFRALKSDGTTAVFDGSCGTSNADMLLSSTAINAGAEVRCGSMKYTQPTV
jgi:hypothetical protein